MENGQDTERPVLAVAADGHALLAAPHNGVIEVFDRAAPAGGWTLRQRLVDPAGDAPGALTDPALAIRDGGGAVVAWTTPGEHRHDRLSAVSRPGAGAFGPVQVLADGVAGAADGRAESFDAYDGLLAFGGGDRGYPPLDDERASLTAVLTAGGDTLVVWETNRGVATFAGTLAAVGARAVRLPPGCRLVSGAVAFLTAGGAPRAAVADDVPYPGLVPYPDAPGSLRVVADPAAALAAARAVPAPALTVAAPATRQRLRVGDPLRVQVTCAAACDVLLGVPGAPVPRFGLAPQGAARLRAGAATPVALRPSPRRRLGPRTTVRVTGCGPGGLATATRALTVRATVVPPAAVVPARDVRARRRPDGRIVVTWRTDRPAARTTYTVNLGRTRVPSVREPFDRRDFALVRGRGRRAFAAVLRPSRPGRRRFAEVRSSATEDGGGERAVVVAVR